MAAEAQAAAGPMLAADGRPLKASLRRAERRRKLAAVGLVAPLFLFIMITFIIPILEMAWRSVDNPQVANVMPQTTELLGQWDGEDLPSEEVFQALVEDMIRARDDRTLGSVAIRLNYEMSGARSLIQGTARRLSEDMEPPYREAVIEINDRWGDPAIWRIVKRESRRLTPSYYLSAVDMGYDAEGNVVRNPPHQRLYLPLFERTLWLSLIITAMTLLLGFPIAYLLANLPLRISNLLMIFVLLPFWTSLLVRTSAWIVLLQQQGVINDILVAVGLFTDDGRMQMVHNYIGTLVAMTHILLPFMVLPLYSVMKTIPPSYVRAARSLGANPLVAFWRVYVPQTVPGIGAGAILVFILSIGYYITPALVGGQSGQLISNLIAFHMQSSLNWGLAAALGTMLLFGVLILYWVYNKLVGIDNMKLG